MILKLQMVAFFSFFSKNESDTLETVPLFCRRVMKSVTSVSLFALPEIAMRTFEADPATGSLPSLSK
jgi:hypothetical protein